MPETEIAKSCLPLGQRILVKRIEKETVSKGGILLPGVAQTKPRQAHVIALGTGKREEKTGERQAFEVAIGDLILLPPYGGIDISLDGEDYIVLNEEDVLGIVKGGSANG